MNIVMKFFALTGMLASMVWLSGLTAGNADMMKYTVVIVSLAILSFLWDALDNASKQKE